MTVTVKGDKRSIKKCLRGLLDDWCSCIRTVREFQGEEWISQSATDASCRMEE